MGLLKACNLTGKYQRALKVGEDLIADYGPEVRAVEQYCWVLRRLGEPDRALAAIDNWLKSAPAGTHYLLLIERARIHAALMQWDKAENDLKDYFHYREEKKHIDYNWFSNACLLQGYLRLQAKDEEGARDAWRKGLLKNVSRLNGPPDPSLPGLYIDPSAVINSMILSALADEPSEKDNDRNAGWLESLAAREKDP